MVRDDRSRQIPERMPKGWVPPVPAWAAQLPEGNSLTIAYYGVQAEAGHEIEQVDGFRSWILALLEQGDGPSHVEFAEFVDAYGYYTWLCIGYWMDSNAHARWVASPWHQGYWLSKERLQGQVGVFRETLSIPSERFETIQSDATHRAGAANACPALQGPIREHNYWGSMRDRLALSAHEAMDSLFEQLPDDGSSKCSRGRRISVNPPANLAVIRSGQAFGDLQGREKEIYFSEIEPALRAGMDYLRDHPEEAGCYSCRLLRETDAHGHQLSRSFGLAHFASLKHLESWASGHPTHLRIFNSFLSMAAELGASLKLVLWHEVAVLPAHGQCFEYLNCHPGTGLLPHVEQQSSNNHDSGVQV